MESEGDAKCLLVVDEKETCVAHFVPENDLEKIWNESERAKDPADPAIQLQKKESIYEYTHSLLQDTCNRIDRHKKATEHPSFRRKILDKINENLEEKQISAEETPKSEPENVTDIEELDHKEENVVCTKQGGVIKKASDFINMEIIKEHGSKLVLTILPNIVSKLYLYLGNKWTWNVIISLLEIGISVFVYLVLACATIMVSVIINYHDANTKCNKHVQFQESEIDRNCKANTIKEEEELGVKKKYKYGEKSKMN